MIFRGKKGSLSFLAAFFLGALSSAADVTPVTEVYAMAADGTPLHWVVYTPTTPAPWPVVLVIHGGGFLMGTPNSSAESVICAQDLAAAGYLALSIEYRLAPPGSLPGQTSNGRFPDQTDDVHLAVHTARADPRCNRKVGAIGGSAGGSHAAFVAATGTPGDDRIDVGVGLSGAYDFTDYSANVNIDAFTNNVTNYVGVPTTDTAALQAASPGWNVDRTVAPLYLVNTLQDPMPYSQLPDMVALLQAAGATNFQTLTLTGGAHAFAYWSTVKDRALAFLAAGFAGTPPPPPSPTPTPGVPGAHQLLNVSTRGNVGTGDDVMIGGFIITGANVKPVLLRGLGPSLAQNGVAGALSDPMLQLYNGAGNLVETNDNWRLPGNLPGNLIPTNSAESLLTAFLPAGNYTTVLSGVNGVTGIGLVELYDLDTALARVSNISTRGNVGTGTNVLIGGFIIGGPDPTEVLVRALGPSLSAFGVSNPLQNPFLQLFDSNGTLVFANDNWRNTQQQQIIATGLPPTSDLESAIVDTLNPGDYTAVVSGVGGTSGIALVEVYNLEPQ